MALDGDSELGLPQPIIYLKRMRDQKKGIIGRVEKLNTTVQDRELSFIINELSESMITGTVPRTRNET